MELTLIFYVMNIIDLNFMSELYLNTSRASCWSAEHSYDYMIYRILFYFILRH